MGVGCVDQPAGLRRLDQLVFHFVILGRLALGRGETHFDAIDLAAFTRKKLHGRQIHEQEILRSFRAKFLIGHHPGDLERTESVIDDEFERIAGSQLAICGERLADEDAIGRAEEIGQLWGGSRRFPGWFRQQAARWRGVVSIVEIDEIL